MTVKELIAQLQELAQQYGDDIRVGRLDGEFLVYDALGKIEARARTTNPPGANWSSMCADDPTLTDPFIALE